MKKIYKFLFYWLIFAVGMFFGEWLLNFIIITERDIIGKEILEAIFMGCFVALFFAFGSIPKKR